MEEGIEHIKPAHGTHNKKKELQFAKCEKDKDLEVRMLMAEKDQDTMKIKECNALLCAVVGSSRYATK
ncbi:hypothetical protein BY996DRAFT_6455992 [Phakopsora pachyrhizi]|nr:hypothetical protein BY996DRAFT_6455992 [Phakopsora pachyrhizi]